MSVNSLDLDILLDTDCLDVTQKWCVRKNVKIKIETVKSLSNPDKFF